MDIALHLPINRLSFGQVSTLILRTLFEREASGEKHNIFLFPIHQVDLSAQVPDEAFNQWLREKMLNGSENYDRHIPSFKLWHLNGSLESVSRNPTLLTFHELDEPTKIERNIAFNNRTLFSSNYSCDVFKSAGVPADFLPLAFDSYNFKSIPSRALPDGRITFNLCGKFEKRKHHEKIIKAWIKKFGNDRRYVLQCAVYNSFLVQQTPQGTIDRNNEVIAKALEGKSKPFNVQFYPSMHENSVYNDFLNSADIIIGMSGGEGWGLPEFQSVAMGKHAVILNAHSYKDWADEKNAVLVQPSAIKIPAYDGMFFQQGQPFNQGNIFDWSEDDFISGCEQAIKRVEAKKINEAGLELQSKFSKETFVNKILEMTK